MSEEKRKILEHLVEYLQDKLDTGYHKIFYNDDMYDEKTIDCINAINNTLEENKRLHSIIKEVREKIHKAIIDSEMVGNAELNLSELLEITYMKENK